MRSRGAQGLATLVVVAALAAAGVGVVGTSSGQEAAGTAAVVPTTRCFGAASRDPERRCVNRALFRTVVPMPAEARSGQNYPCTPVERTAELYPCVFGARFEDAERTIALVGDSHAAHWRAALDWVANARGWHGISLTQTGCPMTQATPILRGRRRDDCLAWNRELIPWLERHPEIRTVFVSQHGAKVVVPPGHTQRSAQILGFRRAFRELPRTVEQIVVLRDTPWSTATAPACIEQALAERRRPDRACAIPRARSLRADLSVDAARAMRSDRVTVLDLTPFMCDRRRCFPVVGGALVHKDGGHITQVFSRTLGPYLGRYVDRAIAAGD